MGLATQIVKGEVVRRFFILALLLFSLTPHWPALRAGFTFDDHQFIEQNASIRSLNAAARSFLGPFPPGQASRGLFRPLTSLSYALDYFWGGDQPFVFHLTNLLLYFIVILLFYSLARRYLRSWQLTLAAALLFSLHPVHCEVVDSLAGRSELLSLLFALLSLNLFIEAASREKPMPHLALLTFSFLGYVLSSLAKETGVMLPFLLLGHVLFFRPTTKQRLLALIPFFSFVPIYMGLRFLALGQLGAQALNIVEQPWGKRLGLFGMALVEYLRLLVFPFQLQVDYYYQHLIVSSPNLSALMAAGLGILVLILVLFLSQAWRAKNHESAALSAFGLCFFLVFLFPVSNLIPTGALMAERFLFFPSVGFVLFVFAVYQNAAAPRPRLAWPIFSILLILFGVRTNLRAAQWKDELSLWLPLVKQIDDDPRIYKNVALGYIQAGQLDQAEKMLRRSIKLRPNDAGAFNNLAAIYQRRGMLAEALQLYQRAVTIDPQHALSWNSLGALQMQLGQLAAAKQSYLRALQINPNYLTAQENLRALKAQEK